MVGALLIFIASALVWQGLRWFCRRPRPNLNQHDMWVRMVYLQELSLREHGRLDDYDRIFRRLSVDDNQLRPAPAVRFGRWARQTTVGVLSWTREVLGLTVYGLYLELCRAGKNLLSCFRTTSSSYSSDESET